MPDRGGATSAPSAAAYRGGSGAAVVEIRQIETELPRPAHGQWASSRRRSQVRRAVAVGEWEEHRGSWKRHVEEDVAGRRARGRRWRGFSAEGVAPAASAVRRSSARGLELKGLRQRSTANNDGAEVGGTEARSCRRREGDPPRAVMRCRRRAPRDAWSWAPGGGGAEEEQEELWW
jgi:hypothetical protein